MQFYPRDWTGDEALACCSLATRGFWIDCLCYMWTAPTRGVLSDKTFADLGRLARCSEDEAEACVKELAHKGVCNADATRPLPDGYAVASSNARVTLRCRRMERDEKGRSKGAERQRRYRERHAADARDADVTPRNAPSSSSSSSSPSTSEKDGNPKPLETHAEPEPTPQSVKDLAEQFHMRIPGRDGRKPNANQVLAFFRDVATSQSIYRLRHWLDTLMAVKCTTIPWMTGAWNEWEKDHPRIVLAGEDQTELDRASWERSRKRSG